MIISFNRYNGGGGSTSAVTPEQVQQQIDSALTPFWDSAETQDAIDEAMSAYTPTSGFSTINGSAITNGGNIVIQGGADMSAYYTSAQTEEAITSKGYVTSADVETQIFSKNFLDDEDGLVISSAINDLRGLIEVVSAATPEVDLSGYYTSAQTEEAISAATAGKADAANVSGNTSNRYFPAWNEQGIITGITDTVPVRTGYLGINGTGFTIYSRNISLGNIYGPQSAGTAGDILVSTGKGAPVWTADNKVSSASVSTIWKGTQAEYDAITTKDPATFYIIVSSN